MTGDRHNVVIKKKLHFSISFSLHCIKLSLFVQLLKYPFLVKFRYKCINEEYARKNQLKKEHAKNKVQHT